MKKIILLSMMLCLGMLSAWADYSYTDENGVTWGFTVSGTEATITSASGYGENLIIPETFYVDETAYTVVATKNEQYVSNSDVIQQRSLFYKKTFSSVSLPSTLRVIGGLAFYGCSIGIINLNNCEVIGEYAFYYCSSLTSVGDLSACTSIGSRAFFGCNILESISLPCSMVATLSATDAFGFTTLVLVPENLLDAYKSADVWKDMASQIFPIGSEPQRHYDIAVSAKENTSDIYSKIGEDQLVYVMKLKLSGTINGYDIMLIRNKMVGLYDLDLTDANIVANDYQYYTGYHTEDNVLGAYSFYNLTNLVHVKLPNTITSIGSYAMSGCTNLQEIRIPEGVTRIPAYAFQNCTSLASVLFPTKLISLSIFAFDGCSALKKVTFPNTLTTIGQFAFQNCTALTAANFPTKMASETVTIENDAFHGCRKLLSITLPENLKSIGQYAFQNCSALAEVRIPSMVTSIGNYAFTGCSALNDVWTYTLVPQAINQNTFSTYTTATLHIQKTSHDPYYFNTQWSQFLNLMEFEGTYSQWLINNETDYVIDDHTGVIDTEDDATGEIEPGSGLISENENEDQQMDEIIIDDNGSTTGSVIGNGHLWCNWLQFLITIMNNKWYFLSFPYRVYLSDIMCDGDWVIRYYDGAARASTGGTGWSSLPAGTEWLEPGVGYIFQCNKAGKLKVRVRKDHLDMNPNDQHSSMTAHPSENAQHASWNYMGNPFTSYFDIDETGYESPITYWDGSKYVAVRPGDDIYHFRPFQAFFVQKPENVSYIDFPKDKRETYNQSKKTNQAKAMRVARRGVTPDRLLIDLTLSNGTDTDKTRVVFNNKKQNAYELDCDASKFLSSGVPQLYTLDNKKVQYAINERPNGGVQVGYTANAAGTYTIEATRMDKPMLLKDSKTGVTFDLNNGSYEFESAAGTFNNRFTLVENGNVTGVADIKTKTGVSIMGMQGGLYVNGAEGKSISIYSADGKLMAEPNGDGMVNLQRGTYVVSVGGMKAKVMVK